MLRQFFIDQMRDIGLAELHVIHGCTRENSSMNSIYQLQVLGGFYVLRKWLFLKL